ncbi:MAG: DUF4423 domain-containing protein [Bdellovibrionia bacterium]
MSSENTEIRSAHRNKFSASSHQRSPLVERDYHEIVIELLLALKGTRSSMELSKALGYKYNQFKRWETGEKQLRWDEFCMLCESLEISIQNVLLNVFQYSESDPKLFLSHLYSNKYPLISVDELSKQLHRHPSAIRRYVDGEIFPDLEFVLAFMNLDSNRLGTFIRAILPPNTGESLRSRFEKEKNQLITEASNPLAAAIEGWLITQGYLELEKHDPAYIAQRVGCSSEEVTQILASLQQARTVKQNENGKFLPTYEKMDMSGMDIELMMQFFKYWYDRATQHYAKVPFAHRGPVRGAGGCRVVAVSQRVSNEINQVILRADAEIRALVDSIPDSEPRDDVRVILLKAFSSQDF